MVMEDTPTPQSVGREFVRQYYTLLNSAPTHLHRFYNHNSLFIHDGLETSHRETKPMVGQKQIHQKIQQLNFRDCHAKITQVDSQATLGSGVVVQVTGELSNGGEPMRRFTQTFVLAQQSPKKYYVHNDIFRYQDMGDDDGEHDSGRSETDEDVDSTPQPPSQYYMSAQGAQPGHHNPPLTPLMNPTAVNGSNHIDDHTALPPQPYLGMPMPIVQPPAAAPVPVSAPTAAQAPTPAATPAPAPTPSQPSAVIPQQPPAAPAPTQAPVSTPTASQASAPAEEREEGGCATEECQEESGEQAPSQGGAALQAQGEAAESEVQQNQQPKEETSATEDKGHEFEDLQLQESVPSEPLTYATLLKGVSSGHKPMGRTTAASPPPPQRSENHTSSSTGNSGSSGPGGLSGMSGLGGLGGSRSSATRPPPRGSHGIRGMGRSSADRDRQGLPRSNMSDDSSSENRRRFPDSHQIFVGNVPVTAGEGDLRGIFSQFGAISDVRVYNNNNKPGNKNRNYAFVTFEEASSASSVFDRMPIAFPGEGSTGTLNIEKKQPRSGGGGGGGRAMQGSSMRGNSSGAPRSGPGGPNGPSPRGRSGGFSRGDGAPGGSDRGAPRNSGGDRGGPRSGGGGGYQSRR